MVTGVGIRMDQHLLRVSPGRDKRALDVDLILISSGIGGRAFRREEM